MGVEGIFCQNCSEHAIRLYAVHFIDSSKDFIEVHCKGCDRTFNLSELYGSLKGLVKHEY